MKKIILIILIFFSKNIYSQNFNGYVVTSSNDTINCKFFVETNLFDNTIFKAVSVRSKVKILNNKNEKIVFKPKDLASFLIKNTKSGDFKFVSFEQDNYSYFYHEVIKGKLSYFKLYQEDKYSGGPNSGFHEFVLKDNILLKFGVFDTRKTLGEQIKDFPELYQKWMDSNNYYKLYQIKEVIKLYNDYFLNKK
ncbi:hypothetical protein [Flavobacterium sp.]|uniref:hypothetical protein n=1 Tax=Flavobacterium sp. TaxID=239 RepID=UPI0038FD0C6A